MTLTQGQGIISASVSSSGSIVYNTGGQGSLKFESSFDSPVTITQPGGAGNQPTAISGADEGYNWASYHTFWDTDSGSGWIDTIDSYPCTDVYSNGPIAPPSGSSSTRALLIGTTASDGVCRNQIDFYMQDGTPVNYGGGTTSDLGNMHGQVYDSFYVWLPSNFELTPQKLGGVTPQRSSNGYINCTGYWEYFQIFGYRDYNTALGSNEYETSIAVNLQANATSKYWYVDERAYIGEGAGFLWDDWYANWNVPVLLGQWSHVEVYIVRSTTNPVIDVWINGVTLVALNKNNMYRVHDPLGAGNSKTYSYTDPYNPAPFTSRGYPNFYLKTMVYYENDAGVAPSPCYFWLDDLQIWNGLPGQ